MTVEEAVWFQTGLFFTIILTLIIIIYFKLRERVSFLEHILEIKKKREEEKAKRKAEKDKIPKEL